MILAFATELSLSCCPHLIVACGSLYINAIINATPSHLLCLVYRVRTCGLGRKRVCVCVFFVFHRHRQVRSNEHAQKPHSLSLSVAAIIALEERLAKAGLQLAGGPC